MRKRVSARPSFMPRSGGEQAKISGVGLTREEEYGAKNAEVS